MAIYDYKKQFKGNRLVGVENRGCNVEYGEYGYIKHTEHVMKILTYRKL